MPNQRSSLDLTIARKDQVQRSVPAQKKSEENRTGFISASADGARLAKNAVFNFGGQILPLLSGIVLIPYIVRSLGPDRFGMLGIIWVVFGYFSLMDLGMGRATTKFLAEWLAKGEESRISEMVWSSIILQLLLGVAGGAVMAALTPFLVERVLKTPPSLVGEARCAFYVLAAALPSILTMNGLRAVLEGCQRFDITNLLRIPANTLAFVIPAAAVAAGFGLPGMVLWMGISRVAFTFAHGFYCLRALPCLKTKPILRSSVIFPLLSFGGWVTVSNAVNPLLLWMDRFMIGSVLSVAMVGYYTAPFEAVTKVWMIPVSLMTTVYPACSALGLERIQGSPGSLFTINKIHFLHPCAGKPHCGDLRAPDHERMARAGVCREKRGAASVPGSRGFYQLFCPCSVLFSPGSGKTGARRQALPARVSPLRTAAVVDDWTLWDCGRGGCLVNTCCD